MKMKDVLKNEENWCKEVCFKDKNGKEVLSAKNAFCFCLLGAISKVYGEDADCSEWDRVFLLIQKEVGQAISTWNDSHTHAEVLALCEKLDI